jgi:arginine decarboxylase-like protein
MDLLIGLLGAGIGSGIMAILLAALQRKWKKDDQQHIIVEQLGKLEQRLDKIEADNEEREAKHARIRLLRFGDECSHEVRHSREHFEQVIEDVDAYETYCREHPEFKNNKAVLTIQIIKDTYQRRLVNNDFI